MMKAVWKYPVRWYDTTVSLPLGATVVSFGYQEGVGPVIWATVDPSRPKRDRTFMVIATGESYDDMKYMYVATTSANGLVWHLLERAPS